MPQPAQMPERGRGFAEGTRILTARGEVPVERIAAGDLVLTLSGLGVPLKPVRRVIPVEAEETEAALRLGPGALAAGMPIRDLVVGPAQPLRVEGVLLAAESLANGLSIRPDPTAGRRWIIELDRPDVIVANGAPAAAWPEALDAAPQDPAQLAAIRAAVAARA
uniref:Hint domain-containing protein n=1 Tax=Falsiroseomonas oryziterrae TaxID=2911368 RepID=UPI001F17DE54